MKTIENRCLRRALNRNPDLVLQNGAYKKYFLQYDICDFYSLVSKTFDEYYRMDIGRQEDLEYIEGEIFLYDGCGWCERCEEVEDNFCQDCYEEGSEDED